MNILGIESSCDDTAASIITDDGVKSNVIASQSIHEQFGGIVPELASRAHHKTILQTVNQALEEADISLDDIELILLLNIKNSYRKNLYEILIKKFNNIEFFKNDKIYFFNIKTVS